MNKSIPQPLRELLFANGWTLRDELDKRLSINNRQRRYQIISGHIDTYTLYVYRTSQIDLLPPVLRGDKKGKKK